MADFGSPVLALVFIAEQKGFFADEDLEIDHLHFDLGRDALTQCCCAARTSRWRT